MSKQQKFQYIGYAGFIAIIIGCFLPWTNVVFGESTAAFNYFSNTNGKLVLLCSLIAIVMVYFKKSKIVFFPIALILIIIASDLKNGTNTVAGFNSLNNGAGVYVVFIGLALSFLYALLFKEEPEKPNIKQQEDLKNLKLIEENNKKAIKKEANYIYCPNCGIRSPSSATICHVCRHSLR